MSSSVELRSPVQALSHNENKAVSLPLRPAVLLSEIKESALPFTPVVRQSFLHVAEQDYTRCQVIVNSLKANMDNLGLNFLFPSNRQKMLDLLGRRIREAHEKGHDEYLYVAYQDLAEMISDWHFADNLKGIIGGTLTALEQGEIAAPRQRTESQAVLQAVPASFEEALQQNALLQRGLNARIKEADEVATRHAQELKAKSDEIQQKDARIDALVVNLEDALAVLKTTQASVEKLLQTQKKAAQPSRLSQFFSRKIEKTNEDAGLPFDEKKGMYPLS